MNASKYAGIFPALYACYEDNGAISAKRTRQLAQHLIEKGVQGLYVGGSSGECIYLNTKERKQTLEAVMEVAGGKLKVIAHVACNNTRDSQDLAAHAQALGVDAIAAIPPIYFHLPEHAVVQYWNDISSAAPDTDFIIYNIPQLAGVALTMPLFRQMLKNPKVIGVKNSSSPVQDIWQWKNVAGERPFAVFNGPDRQLLAGLANGADGGIGGTYGVMPELYLKIYRLYSQNRMEEALQIQNDAAYIVSILGRGKGSIYAVEKEILYRHAGIALGGVRSPLPNIHADDAQVIDKASQLILTAVAKADALL